MLKYFMVLILLSCSGPKEEIKPTPVTSAPAAEFVIKSTLGPAGGFLLLPGMGKVSFPANSLPADARIEVQVHSLNQKLPANTPIKPEILLATSSEIRIISSVPVKGEVVVDFKLPVRFSHFDKSLGEMIKMAGLVDNGSAAPQFEEIPFTEASSRMVMVKLTEKNFTKKAPYSTSFFAYAVKGN